MGMYMRDESILPARLTMKEARLGFLLGYSAEEFDRTARALEVTGFQPEAMVSNVLPLERVGDAIESIRAGCEGSEHSYRPEDDG